MAITVDELVEENARLIQKNEDSTNRIKELTTLYIDLCSRKAISDKRIEDLEYELSCESHEKDLKGYDGYQWG